jgi:apolipoprotein N-acyltransferase
VKPALAAGAPERSSPSFKSLSVGQILIWFLIAIGSFQIAYTFASGAFLMLLHLFALLRLTSVRTARQAMYIGLAVGFAMYAPQLRFFWTIFHGGAIALWLVLAFWIGVFTITLRQCRLRFGSKAAALLAPVLWLGFDFFRGELYYLRFTWLNVGYAFSDAPLLLALFGVYGLGFVLVALAAALELLPTVHALIALLLATGGLAMVANPPASKTTFHGALSGKELRVAGVQLEFPSEPQTLLALEAVRRANPQTDLFVLSEYTFDGPVPERIRNWCRTHQKFLIAGGKDPLSNERFRNTAFVVGTNGAIVFQQAKAVPIQFFKDGLPAAEQKLWNSPWGAIGICICYDLSYTRVTDPLIRAGAQALIVPTMDVENWGEHQHQLHSRVAPTRAAEYGLPVFRVASSGISQLVGPDGIVQATAPFAKQDAQIAGTLRLAVHGTTPWDRLAARISVVITAVTVSVLITDTFIRRKRKSKTS